MSYIVVRNWERFQHYSDRSPIWIKSYCALMSDDAFLDLSFHLRGVLLSIWLEYATSRRQLSDNTATLTRHLGHRVLTRDIESLVHAGFIEISASKPLAERYQDASLEEKREEPTPIIPSRGKGARAPATERIRALTPTQSAPRLTKRELAKYTGCKATRGTHSSGWKYDPLGTAKPPPGWTHAKPTAEQIQAALAKRGQPTASQRQANGQPGEPATATTADTDFGAPDRF